MTLLELFQSDAKMQGVLTKIMTQRSRMKYRRREVEQALKSNGFDFGYVSTGQVYELHYFLHPDQPRRVLKQNMTRPKK